MKEGWKALLKKNVRNTEYFNMKQTWIDKIKLPHPDLNSKRWTTQTNKDIIISINSASIFCMILTAESCQRVNSLRLTSLFLSHR